MRQDELNGSTRFSMMRVMFGMVVIALFCSLSLALAAEAVSTSPQIPVEGMVTLLAVGSEHCVPCRIMAPIMKKLKEEYTDRAAIICLDSSKEKELASKFKARVTPTLILFDREGKELKRHEGVMDKKSIVAMLNEAGVK